MPRYWLGVALVLISGSSALARIPKYNRPEVTVPVTLSERTKPRQYAQAPVAKPIASADDVLSIPSLVQPPRLDQEKLLEQLIQDTSDSHVDEKSDYLFRLGELQARQVRHHKVNGNANGSKDYLIKAVRTFKRLVDNDAFRNYAKMDMALFYYGYTLQTGKYMKEARAVYDKLLKNYPNSKFVPEAHLAFAEYYFESGQMADAEARYKMVLKFPKSPSFTYAHYKLGWIHFQLMRHQEALESFFNVAMAAKGNQNLDALARAARLDFVRAYAEIGKADKAYVAFQRVDAAAAFEMLDLLGTIYAERDQADKTAIVFKELQMVAPKDPRICTWQYRIAHSSLSAIGGTNLDKVRAIDALVVLYSGLAKRNALPARELQECKANAVALTGDIARAWHRESIITRNAETIDLAVKLYQLNVDTFPNEATSADNRYFFAEALWTAATWSKNDREQRELFEHSAAVFSDVARNDRQRQHVATYASVLAWLNSFDTLPNATPNLTSGRPAPARPLPAKHQQVVDAINAYARTLNDPRNADLGQLRMIEARLYRAADQHDKAAPLYVSLIATHATADFAEGAAMLAIDTLVLLQRLDEMLALADRLAADSKFLADKPELVKVIQHVRTRSMRR